MLNIVIGLVLGFLIAFLFFGILLLVQEEKRTKGKREKWYVYVGLI